MSSFSEEAEEAHNNSRTAYDSSNTVLEQTKEDSSLMERSTAQMAKIDQIIYESVQVDGIRTISDNLSVISTNSEKMNTSIQVIAAISEESAAGIEETSASSEQISSSMEEVVSSSDELASLAEELNELIH
ncbi:hypothetical protein [Oceanobacillus alkalisoli]|uniref:hypothetical protein n=1 Tax=Oceanobacillus alkalisoli TaxID=2925113 RepID=UPI001EE3D04C|nr:hypothetical protein [Oceanobacillus alkalisoli]MCG5102267.1 hypothetical protein [Oceanobacillus alkalisoli]